MAKIYPQALLPPPPPSSNLTSRRDIFTIWMKSLVFNGNGCTVFDSNGQIVYRIDNYSSKCSNKVYLMDLRGNILVSILRKKYGMFKHWKGYKCYDPKSGEEKPWFKVRKPWRILKEESPCEVTVGWDRDQSNCYRIEGVEGKSACRIVETTGKLVAEIKQKQSTSGVMLGDDVLSLEVEPNTDHSFVMGLVVVYSLINHRM